MWEDPYRKLFSPEMIDEQIVQLRQGMIQDPAAADLIKDLEQVYREEVEEQQAIERIGRQLTSYTMQAQPTSEQPVLPSGDRHESLQRRKREKSMRQTATSNGQTWTRRFGFLAAVLIATLLVGSVIALWQVVRERAGETGSTPPKTTTTLATQQTYPGMYLRVNNQMIKVDSQTHNIVWRYTINSNPNEISISSAPIVVGKSVYFTAMNTGYSLDAQTGKLNWQRDFQSDVFQQYMMNDVLYVCTSDDGNLFALNPVDGSTKIQYKVRGSLVGVFDGVIYLMTSTKNTNMLSAIRASDGSRIWQTRFDVSQSLNQVYVKNGTLYASSYHNKDLVSGQTPPGSYAYTIDPRNGRITWQSPLIQGTIFDIAVGDEGQVYWRVPNHFVAAFDPKTNKLIWSSTVTGNAPSAPLVQNGIMYLGLESANGDFSNDRLEALDAATGQQKWVTPLHGYSTVGDLVPPVLKNGTLYVGTRKGLTGIAASNGKVLVTISNTTLLGTNDRLHSIIEEMVVTIVS